MFINKNFFYINFKKVPNPKANIIITHGLGESSQDYLPLADFLCQAGYNVILYDVRGHGKSGGSRGDVNNFHVLVDDLASLVKEIKKKSSLKIFLIGHSMGGIITNAYMVKYGEVNGSIISSAPTHTLNNKHLKYPFYWFNFKPRKLNFLSNKIAHTPIYKGYFPYHLEYVTPRLMRNLLVLSPQYLQKRLSFYVGSVLFLYSIQDKIISFKNGSFLFEKVPSKDKKLILYQESYHNLFHDIEAAKAFEDTVLWLDQRY
ncbi:MAG: Monoacylglycerol lipase [Candidatus Phytoplasma pruni]